MARSTHDEKFEMNGAIFMREDLVSWTIEKSELNGEYGYIRAVYKEPNPQSKIIDRSDATPVYLTDKQ